jgi:hypothetical protein
VGAIEIRSRSGGAPLSTASAINVRYGPHVYELTCPNCGTKVKVPSGPHSVVPTPAAGGKSSGITIDGKSAHRCGADVVD